MMGGNPVRFAITSYSSRRATYIAGDLGEGVIRFWRYSRASSREDAALGIEPWPYSVTWLPGLSVALQFEPGLYVERAIGIALTGEERAEIGARLDELVEMARGKEPEALWSSAECDCRGWFIDDTPLGFDSREELYIECGDERPPVIIDNTLSFVVPSAYRGFTNMIHERFHLAECRWAVDWGRRMSDAARSRLVGEALGGNIDLVADILMHGKGALIELLVEEGKGQGLAYDFSEPDEYLVGCGRSTLRGFRRYSARRCIELFGPVFPGDSSATKAPLLQGVPS